MGGRGCSNQGLLTSLANSPAMALISKDGVGVSPSKVAPAGTSGSSGKCGSCGSTSIDVDPSRAEAVCTNCGDVIEASNIVADVQFEENAHGGMKLSLDVFVS